jgi:hypothetical protein
VNGDPGSTQILTWHCGAKSQTVSQFMNLRTAPTRQVLIVQPLHVIETPMDGSVCMPHHLLTTQTEPWGFIKPSAQNKVVHTELSLYLSFHLSCSLEGYAVGTTTGF